MGVLHTRGGLTCTVARLGRGGFVGFVKSATDRFVGLVVEWVEKDIVGAFRLI